MVHRGKYSEGYNFKDDLCRGVFMIGVPKKNIREPKIIMKEIFYQKYRNLLKRFGSEKEDSFKEYYERQTNQVSFRIISLLFKVDNTKYRKRSKKLKRLLFYYAMEDIPKS
jgi:hypothetical protein